MIQCSGKGLKPVAAKSSSLYPACPVCGKEFSSQGRKHRYSRANWWLVGCPPHTPLKGETAR